MLVDHQRKAINTSLRFIHLALQIIVGYWAIVIDGYPSQDQYVRDVTYCAYALILFNIILFALFFSNFNSNRTLFIILLVIDLCLTALMLYFTIEGYNKYNTCAQSKALYEFFFIEIIISIILLLMIMFAKTSWVDVYAHWPGNLAWPILFLKWSFPQFLHISAIVIGVIYLLISLASFIVNIFQYNSFDSRRTNIVNAQWGISLILMLACQILAIVKLVTSGFDGDYNWHYGRAIFVIFAGVNIIDFIFWIYGYRRLASWISSI